VDKEELGTVCDRADQCASGFCSMMGDKVTHGVCCDSACNETCMVCNMPTAPGACLPATYGTDPALDCGICQHCDGEGGCTYAYPGSDPLEDCPEEPDYTCGTTGVCDGLGACEFWSSDIDCAASGCMGDVFLSASYCDGQGQCVASDMTNCSPYVCDSEIGCRESCTVDEHCVEGARCIADPQTEELACIPSCEGYCGETNPLGCFCDSSCASSGDCCTDVCSHCEWFWCGPSTCGGSCSGKECGDDGCGFSCGSCQNGMTCENYTCVSVTEGFVPLTAGSFWMGSPDGCPGPDGYPGDCTAEPGRGPAENLREVVLTRHFEIMSHEVTRAQWAQWGYRDDWDPSIQTGCSDCPVENVSWFEALIHANQMSNKHHLPPCYYLDNVVCVSGARVGTQWRWCMNYDNGGIASASVSLGNFATPYQCSGYRLPTSAEWEFAARAGALSAYHNGLDADEGSLGCESPFHLTDIAWYCANTGVPQRVAQLEMNDTGLFDMSGNVSEWVWDGTGEMATRSSGGNVEWDPVSTGPLKVYRGGSWNDHASALRSAAVAFDPPEDRISMRGFRLVRTIQCIPVCNDAECGDDGCGGSCGECDVGYECQEGACVQAGYCGDLVCDAGTDEDCRTCPGDCGDCCGNGLCSPNDGEDCGSCTIDCGDCCGDGYCDTMYEEGCATCPQDCGDCTGVSCAHSSGCESGYCVDGVCCESACEGPCMSCSMSAYEGWCTYVGYGSDPDGDCGTCQFCNGYGTCVPVYEGGDPLDHCPASDPSTCGFDGTCDGYGECRLWENGTICQPAGCWTDTMCDPRVCDDGECWETYCESCDFGCLPDHTGCAEEVP
jgi:formylglycine-generating enzyme required for sulfatase activity